MDHFFFTSQPALRALAPTRVGGRQRGPMRAARAQHETGAARARLGRDLAASPPKGLPPSVFLKTVTFSMILKKSCTSGDIDYFRSSPQKLANF